ncbi:hypothetical protein CLI72_10385 [Porphyromonas gingivalis]|nr:hypothetical protein CS546_09685 [Porphyromonas gingivalis]ERJ68318.1 hypothetical protein HMPREF1553_01101 [Porphyromonas gingivalis F0568]ERJ69328.1 hypothetical protein HMPREF1554_00663 [Porphyromonas gingivalis F0569]ERJ80694.1 hypothetical protein HMPREF1988_02268 [Porphyromonas gingivalis F0185]ATR96523.1 hypothetical protein CS548_05155 [Porphyromonas gingivalis]
MPYTLVFKPISATPNIENKSFEVVIMSMFLRPCKQNHTILQSRQDKLPDQTHFRHKIGKEPDIK